MLWFHQVTVRGKEWSYIASQGPLSSTCQDFWQMVWEQGVSIIAMVTAEEVKINTSEIWVLYTVALFNLMYKSLHHRTGLCCVPSCRKGVVRRVSAIGLVWALVTTLLHTGDLRSPRASARTLGATPQRAWRSNTSWRDRSEPSGTCSTQTGPTTAARRTLKASSVSTALLRGFLHIKCTAFGKPERKVKVFS